MAKVILKFQESLLKEYPLNKEILTIGRKPDTDIRIDNLAVSGYHAKIIVGKDSFFIEDTNSLNGTFINGVKVMKHQLRDGDVVNVGKHTLLFEIPEAAGKTSQPIKSPSMDETLVISPDVQQKYMQQKPFSPQAVSGDPQKGEPLGSFVVIEGTIDKREYLLRDRVLRIGKEEGSEIQLKGFFKPKVAAIINRKKEGYFISPASRKPLKVNGEAVNERKDLKDGDMVEVAGVKLQFLIKE